MTNLDYLTDDFIRGEVGIWGAKISDEDCETIRAYIHYLDERGEFHHNGVYWIANRLASEGRIQPQLPARPRTPLEVAPSLLLMHEPFFDIDPPSSRAAFNAAECLVEAWTQSTEEENLKNCLADIERTILRLQVWHKFVAAKLKSENL